MVHPAVFEAVGYNSDEVTGFAFGMGVERMVGRVRESVEVVKAAGPTKPLNYKGKIFQVWNYQPTWATDTVPRVYVGANKPQMMRMAARVADHIMVGDPLTQDLYGIAFAPDAALADQLKGLFLFVNRCLVQADVEHDPQLVRDGIHILEIHRETWITLMDRLQQDRTTDESPEARETPVTSWLS